MDKKSNIDDIVNLLIENNKKLTSIYNEISELDNMLQVIGRITLKDILNEVDAIIQDRQLSMLETMDYINNGYSISRFGDGEIRLMLQPEFNLSFQKSDRKLQFYLKKLFLNYDETYVNNKLLLCMPTVFTSRLWMGIYAENWYKFKPLLLASTKKWGNTHVSRPLFFSQYKNLAVKLWRKCWENKNVCLITGKGSRFSLIPELFNNIKSLIRIDTSPINAFDDYDKIINESKKVSDVDLFLVSLGPTASILSGLLCSKLGQSTQTLDIGHISSSYLNVFQGTAFPEQLPIEHK